MTQDDDLRQALIEYASARNELHAAIRDARSAGATLRAIADIVGLSVETVRKITMKES